MPLDFLIGAGLAAAATMGIGAAPARAAIRPITLATEAAGESVRLKVIGSADEPVEAAYSLEVTSKTGGGTSRSMQSGKASLRPGVPMTLVSLTLGNVSGGGWTAKLSVSPSGGAAYEVVAGSGSAVE